MGWLVTQNPKTKLFHIYSTVIDAFITNGEVDEDGLKHIWRVQFGESGTLYIEKMLEGIKSTGFPFNHERTYESLEMWHYHNTEHAFGSCSPENAPRKPETCKICEESEERDGEE